jgi:hypothetical protein
MQRCCYSTEVLVRSQCATKKNMNPEHIHNASLLLQYWSTVLVQSRRTTKKEHERRTHTSSFAFYHGNEPYSMKKCRTHPFFYVIQHPVGVQKKFQKSGSEIDQDWLWSMMERDNHLHHDLAKPLCDGVRKNYVQCILGSSTKKPYKDRRIKLQNVRAPQRMGCTRSTAADSDYRY